MFGVWCLKKGFAVSIQPEGEALRKAVKWISEERRENPQQNIIRLIEAASIKFDLSPKEAEFLYRFCKEQKDG